MKKLIIYLLATLTILTLTACQATPETPIVIGKGDGLLEQKIEEQGETAIPSDIPKSGEHITDSFKHKTLDVTVNVDAYVENTAVDSLPAAKVKPVKFDGGRLNKVLYYFIGDNYFFDYDHNENGPVPEPMAKININEWEDMLKKPDLDAESKAYIEAMLEDARQNYLKAKPVSDFPVCSREMKKPKYKSADVSEMIYGYINEGDNISRLIIRNDEKGIKSSMEYTSLNITPSAGKFNITQNLLPNVDYNTSLKLAQDTLMGMGATNMVFGKMNAIEHFQTPEHDAYQLTFVREFNGVVCVEGKGLASDIAGSVAVNEQWEYEKIIVTVAKDGVSGVYWQSPTEISEVLAEKTAIISFEKTMEVFKKMLMVKSSYLESEMQVSMEFNGKTYKADRAVIDVNRIVLGLMRVQSGKEFILIPVWDFYASRESFAKDGTNLTEMQSNAHYSKGNNNPAPYVKQSNNVLTINAVDGSIIDKELGY